MPADFDHVLVTGAAGAIGSAIARRLASRSPRARFTLVDKSPIAIAREIPNATALTWDLEDPSAIDAAYEEATRGAPVDALVNCAGFMHFRSFTGTSWTLGRALLDVDLISPLRLMSLALPSMRAARRGVVVNVSSMAGVVPLRGSTYYGAAKAGLAMASEVARLELAPDNVHVLTVYPGPVASALERGARAELPSTLISRTAKSGDPDVLARKILAAIDRRSARVVYPPIYAAAFALLPFARRMTERFSPSPHQ